MTAKNEDLRVGFDRRLKLKFLGSQVTTDAGLLAYRELDEALGLTEMGARCADTISAWGSNKQHGLSPLLRQSIYSRLAGYEDVNDAERLCVDPAMRHVVGGRASQPEKQAASTSEVGRFETEILSTKENLTALMNLSGQWIDKVHRRQPLEATDPRHGQLGQRDLRKAGGHGLQRALRMHLLPSAVFVQPVRRSGAGDAAARQQRQRQVLAAGAAAGDRAVSPLETFPSSFAAMRPSPIRRCTACWRKKVIATPFASRPTPCWSGKSSTCSRVPWDGLRTSPRCSITASSIRRSRGSESRRVVAKIEWHAGELFPRVGFIVTNLTWRSKSVVKFYNGRGTAEQWIKEGKNAVKWTKLSCRTFKDNQTRLAVVRLGLQPGQLPAAAGLAETGATLVADDAAGEADQDRGQGDAAREVRDVPTGRGGRDAELVRGDPRPHRAAGDAAAGCWSDACVERHERSGKGFGLRGRSAHCRRRSPEKHLVGHGSGRGNSETGAVGEKMEKNSLRARRGGGARCYNGGRSEPGSVPGSAHMGNVSLRFKPI